MSCIARRSDSSPDGIILSPSRLPLRPSGIAVLLAPRRTATIPFRVRQGTLMSDR